MISIRIVVAGADVIGRNGTGRVVPAGEEKRLIEIDAHAEIGTPDLVEAKGRI